MYIFLLVALAIAVAIAVSVRRAMRTAASPEYQANQEVLRAMQENPDRTERARFAAEHALIEAAKKWRGPKEGFLWVARLGGEVKGLARTLDVTEQEIREHLDDPLLRRLFP